MYILNGRFDKDLIGKATSKNNSVVDYVVSSGQSLYKVESFEVLEFSKLFSDIHSPLFLSLCTCNIQGYTENSESFDNDAESIGEWKHQKANEYKNSIDID